MMPDAVPTLTPCFVCGNDVAKTAPTCPHCGVEHPGSNGQAASDSDASALSVDAPRCRACKEPVESDAKKCPHCGTDHPTLSGGAIWATIIVVSLIVIVVCVGMFTCVGGSSSDDGDRTGDFSGAWVYMQAFVEKRLKAPGSAEFPFSGLQHVKDLGGGRYAVDAHVDAQNSFGGQMRTEFYGVIRKTSSGWELESLVFE